jgi:hypothetical protein
MIKINKDEFVKVCNEELSMARAASKLGIHFNTFKRYAVKYGVYNPNQSGRGMAKKDNGTKIPISEILDGKYPQYQTNKLRIRLIKEGIKKEECELCGIEDWLGKRLAFELDHVDGNSNNHLLNNLRIVCPNCHSQTETYRAKNISKK